MPCDLAVKRPASRHRVDEPGPLHVLVSGDGRACTQRNFQSGRGAARLTQVRSVDV